MRRSFSACYNEHSIKLSDSYCWGPSRQGYLSPNPSPLSSPYSVSCIYRAKLLAQRTFLITLTWSDHLARHGLDISIAETPSDSKRYWLEKKRGDELFQFFDAKIRVSWDLCSALFSNGPEPSTGYYVTVWVDSELCLCIGDKSNEDDETARPRNAEAKGRVIWRSERYSGNWLVYRTKARFSEKGGTHEIEINCVGDWNKGRALSLSIDGKRALELEKLRWNFRGNETIFVDGVVVDLMWDLYGWLFRPSGAAAAAAVFLFRTRPAHGCRLWLHHHRIDQDGSYNFSLFISATQSGNNIQ